MSTGNVPSPLDSPTGQAPSGNPQTQDAAAKEPQAAPAAPPAPFDLSADIANIIEQGADVLAQRLVYHSQIMYGVGAVGVDAVNAKNAALVLANALRNKADVQGEQSLVGLGDPQVVQINDGTLPFKSNAQVAGLFEGLVIDTVSRAYASDPTRAADARRLLDGIFQPANDQMDRIVRQLSHIEVKPLALGTPESR